MDRLPKAESIVWQQASLLWDKRYFFFSFEKWLLFLKKEKHVLLYRACFVAAGCVPAYQIFCGICFFARLLQGETYFMAG